MEFDYSTIDLEALRRLPLYRVPRGNHLQEDPGNGCFLDPPGYPTYFTRSVYTSRGDNPRHGPSLVIVDPDDEDRTYVVDEVDLGALWIPVEVGHSRFLYWERECYRHWRNCYYNPEPDESGLHIFFAHFAPEWRVANIRHKPARLRTRDEEEILETANHPELVAPGNHYVVCYIRQFYPAYYYKLEWIQQPPTSVAEHWWERYAHPH